MHSPYFSQNIAHYALISDKYRSFRDKYHDNQLISSSFLSIMPQIQRFHVDHMPAKIAHLTTFYGQIATK